MLTLAAFVAGSLMSLPVAAFKLGPHQQILQSTIAPRIGAAPFTQIVGDLISGRGNLGSDQHQFDDYRHFDSAPSRTAVCDRANAAWNRFYAEIRDSVQPQNGPEFDQIGGVADARSSFGALTHALQDFYSHSNWVELYVQRASRRRSPRHCSRPAYPRRYPLASRPDTSIFPMVWAGARTAR